MKPDELRGHLDPLLLAVLEQGPGHGYAIVEAVRVRSGGVLDLPTGTLYPALRRLERAGYLRSKWSTVSGRNRRTYQLTAAGQRSLTAARSDWREFATVIENLLSSRSETPGPA